MVKFCLLNHFDYDCVVNNNNNNNNKLHAWGIFSPPHFW